MRGAAQHTESWGKAWRKTGGLHGTAALDEEVTITVHTQKRLAKRASCTDGRRSGSRTQEPCGDSAVPSGQARHRSNGGLAINGRQRLFGRVSVAGQCPELVAHAMGRSPRSQLQEAGLAML